MTTALILLVSGVLIGAGISLIVRDSRGRRRRAFVLERDARPKADAEAEITISYDGPPSPSRPKPAVLAGASLADAAGVQAETGNAARRRSGEDAHTADRSPPAARTVVRPPQETRQPLEQEWAGLQPAVAGGVDKVNAVLAPVRLSVSSTGEPSWSYKNRGYGAYRRVLLAGESVAWLRLELSPDGRLNATLKAHKEERTEINASAGAMVHDLTAARAADLLSQCLKPAAAYATRQQPGRDSEEDASKRAWEGVDAVVAAALKATNGALAQAGARLVPLAPAAWESDLRRHRMTLSVEVNGGDVARMHIERHAHEMEVAVGVREPLLIDLGRRRRVPIEGMTIHALAELLASCAWPAIARFREMRPPA